MNKSLNSAQWAAVIFIIGAVGFGVVPLVWFAITHDGLQSVRFDLSIARVLVFTLHQALLSTVISVVLGLFVARALVRRDFFGKHLLMSVFAVPFTLPAIVAVLGVSEIYGARGWFGSWFNLYGLHGIVLVHVFFNLPLAAKVFYGALEGLNADRFKLAAQLSFSNKDVFWHIEWPVLRAALPAVFNLIFLLCAASFVVVLTLGGPAATTLEVAIFQTLRMDFDVGRVLALCSLQIFLCLVLVFLNRRMVLRQSVSKFSVRRQIRYDGTGHSALALDVIFIVIATLIVLPPLLVLAWQGASNLDFDATLASAIVTSVLIGLGSSLVSLTLAWPLAQMRYSYGNILSLAVLIVPPAVMATGWFLAINSFDTGLRTSFVLVAVLNGLMTLPFSVAILSSRFAQFASSQNKMCEQLNIDGWNKFWIIELPLMRRAMQQAGLLAFVMSLGDLTAVILLGSQGLITLPALIHLQMGNYRSDAASGTALLLALICFGLALLAQRMENTYDKN